MKGHIKLVRGKSAVEDHIFTNYEELEEKIDVITAITEPQVGDKVLVEMEFEEKDLEDGLGWGNNDWS